MRRISLIGVIGVAIVLASARPAFAQWGIIKWLEELSGPGPFWALVSEVHYPCFLRKPPDRSPDEKTKLDGLWDRRTVNPGKLKHRLWVPEFACDQVTNMWKSHNPLEPSRIATWKDVHSFITVGGAYGGRGDNKLEYADPGTKKNPAALWSYVYGGYTYRFSPVTDIGSSVGFITFSGSTVATSADKVAIDGFAVIRPLVLNPKWERLEQFLDVRLGVTYYPQGFTLEDFGAIGGSEVNGKPEWKFNVGFLLKGLSLPGW